MSLRGRWVIDQIRARAGRYLRLPCPPYRNPAYWQNVYEKLGCDDGDVFEWANLHFRRDLLQHTTSRFLERYEGRAGGEKEKEEKEKEEEEGASGGGEGGRVTWFEDVIGVSPEETAPILLLGCGNSRLGEEMVEAGWRGPLFHTDVSSHLIHSLTQRYEREQQKNSNYNNTMEFIEDDARSLSAFQDGSMDAVVDKGLVDAFFCASENSHNHGGVDDGISQILQSCHRVLKPGGVLAVFSFSQPEFLIPSLAVMTASGPLNRKNRMRKQPNNHQQQQQQQQLASWQSLEVREINRTILLYRFEKSVEKVESGSALNNRKFKRKVGGKVISAR